jgi:hypothetical protein
MMQRSNMSSSTVTANVSGSNFINCRSIDQQPANAKPLARRSVPRHAERAGGLPVQFTLAETKDRMPATGESAKPQLGKDG